MKNAALVVFSLFLAVASASFFSKNNRSAHLEKEEIGAAFELQAMARLFPDGRFFTEKMSQAVAQKRLEISLRGGGGSDWQPLGPCNRAGRALCLAFHPTNPNEIWVGTASGGIWKTTTAGIGPTAWERVPTGFATLGVSSIVIDQTNPNVIFLGTGEVYNFENSMPSVAVRTTRGSYGIGILKSTDGGATWKKSLDWSLGDLRGVEDIKANPLKTTTLYAATTEGVFRTYDSGETWKKVSAVKMAVDLEINPLDTSTILVTHGSLDDDAISGIYRSKNGGNSFQKLTNGLPISFSGKTLLTLSPQNPSVIFASVSDAFAQIGLFRSTDGGDNWAQINADDISTYQGWYAHDVAVSPLNSQKIIQTGIDSWRSDDGGVSFSQKSFWNLWPYNEVVPVGGPEGPPEFVHADIHRAYFHPLTNDLFMVTDGGVFASTDGGETFSGRNGGLQTMQFYNHFACSMTNPDFAIGGAQDNNSNIFEGTTAWRLGLVGGDGCSAAIRPDDDQTFYATSQYLGLVRFDQFGSNYIQPPFGNETACFVAPYELAPTNFDLIFAGAASLFRSFDRGDSWENVSGGPIDADGNSLFQIAVCPTDADLIFVSTAPTVTNSVGVFKSTDGGQTFSKITGLPNRMCMNIAFSPDNQQVVYAVFSGFNENHVWKTTDGGSSWQPLGVGQLPDVPTNCIFIDPLKTTHIYVGNDVGLWFSPDGGATWQGLNGSQPDATMVYSLAYSPVGRKLRIATYGLGLWQTDLVYDPISTTQPVENQVVILVSPNPASEETEVKINLPQAARASLQIFDESGRLVKTVFFQKEKMGESSQPIELSGLPSGVFAAVLDGRFLKNGRAFRTARFFVKQ